MKKYYFTFGESERYPYQNTYIVIVADDFKDALHGFWEKYPGFLNCSNCYDEVQWKSVRKCYVGQRPAEVIWTETCLGKKPKGYEDLFVFVAEIGQIIRIVEGDGGNLFPEDVAKGYVDYVYYEQYRLCSNMPEVDGGQLMLREPLRQKYACLADSISDVLDLAYGSSIMDCRILA